MNNPSTQWTPKERLAAIDAILKKQNELSCSEYYGEALRGELFRLSVVVCDLATKPPEFLEAHRNKILQDAGC